MLGVVLVFIVLLVCLVTLVWMFVHWGPQLPPVAPDKLVRNMEYRPDEEWSPTLHGEIWGDDQWWSFKLYVFGLIKVHDYPHEDGPVFMTANHWRQALDAFKEHSYMVICRT